MSDGSLSVAQPPPLSSSRLFETTNSSLTLGGNVALTACSGSSTARSGLETPRTGGGVTARSGGEKGTPRDVQRLALGERFPDSERKYSMEGFAGQPLHSPQHTARSAALSSEPWSMRTSRTQSDALSSSRSRSDSLGYSPEEMALNIPAHLSGASSNHFHLDLQKTLENIRFVIIKENQKLREALQQSRGTLTEAATQLDQQKVTAPVSEGVSCDAGLAASPVQEPHRVEWRLQGMANVLALGSLAPDCSYSERTTFRLPAFPGLDFELIFFPWSGCALRANDASLAKRVNVVEGSQNLSHGCELQLHVSGKCASIEMRVVMKIILDKSGNSQESLCSAESIISGNSHASCRTSWPAGWPGDNASAEATVLCQVEIEELSWGFGHLNLSSSWQPPA